MKTLVNTLVKVLVDTLANTLQGLRRALPPSPETPYQPTAGLTGIFIYIYIYILISRFSARVGGGSLQTASTAFENTAQAQCFHIMRSKSLLERAP